jgi:hypothetical protein
MGPGTVLWPGLLFSPVYVIPLWLSNHVNSCQMRSLKINVLFSLQLILQSTHFICVQYFALFLLSIFTLIIDNVKTKRLPFCNQCMTTNNNSKIKFLANKSTVIKPQLFHQMICFHCLKYLARVILTLVMICEWTWTDVWNVTLQRCLSLVI